MDGAATPRTPLEGPRLPTCPCLLNHDALWKSRQPGQAAVLSGFATRPARIRDRVLPLRVSRMAAARPRWRSEEHTSELQSQSNLVCRLLLEKKKKQPSTPRFAP